MGKRKKVIKKAAGGKSKTALLSAPLKASSEFEGLAGFEELSTCTLIKRSIRGEIRRETWQDGKIVKKVRNMRYDLIDSLSYYIRVNINLFINHFSYCFIF